MFDRWGVRVGAVLGSKFAPREHMDTWKSSPWEVQDGLGIVLVRLFCRLAVRGRFFHPLVFHWARFGARWGLRWPILGSLSLSLACFRLLRGAFMSLQLLHSLFFVILLRCLLSSLGPSALCNPGRRTARSH